VTVAPLVYVENFGPIFERQNQPATIFVSAYDTSIGARSLYEYHLPPVGSTNGSWIRHAPVAAGGLAQIYPGPLLPTNPPSFFVTTANKWLTKMNFDGSVWKWKIQDQDIWIPPGLNNSPVSFPGAVIGPPEPGVRCFIYGEDLNLWELIQKNVTTDTWDWTAHNRPEFTSMPSGIKLQPGPLPINSPPHLFIIAKDGDLYENYWDQSVPAWLWKLHPAPSNVVFTPFPGALTAPVPGTLHTLGFFIPTVDGKVFEHRLPDPTRNNWVWYNHGAPPGTKIIGRPRALIQDEGLSPGGPQFFFYGLTGGVVNLWDRVGKWNTNPNDNPHDWLWQRNDPPQGSSGATAIEDISEAFKSWPPRFFVTSNGSLWEYQWVQNKERWIWLHHDSPPPGLFGTFP
jgi:hypothetical protein